MRKFVCPVCSCELEAPCNGKYHCPNEKCPISFVRFDPYTIKSENPEILAVSYTAYASRSQMKKGIPKTSDLWKPHIGKTKAGLQRGRV